jgi:hypothetical protein
MLNGYNDKCCYCGERLAAVHSRAFDRLKCTKSYLEVRLQNSQKGSESMGIKVIVR